MNRDAVADRELDGIAIGHGELALLGISRAVLVARVGWQRALDEDRLAIGAMDLELGLEQPSLVLGLGRLLLTVDEEQAHQPVVTEAPDDAADMGVRLLLVDRDRPDLARPERQAQQ